MATVPKVGKFLEVPFSSVMPLLLGSAVFSGFAVWANKAAFNVPPPSMSPEFLVAASEKDGIAERMNAPAVFLNPIGRGIPGNIRGPDDV